MNVFQAIIIAIVEGLTEFLPISSTGHMIIAQKILGIAPGDFISLFTVNIQFGAILSVLVLYWKRFIAPLKTAPDERPLFRKFLHRYDFYLKLLVAVMPAAILGLLLNDYINSMLGSVLIVAVSLVLGGIVLVFVDNWFQRPIDDQQISYPKAFIIGVFQVISMIPGVSRAAATIIGGLTQKLTRKNAAEFSFFLAVPTMLGASLLELYKKYEIISSADLKILIIGNVVAFFVAMAAIKGFITFLSNHGFKAFGYYRIVVGLVILILLALGIDLSLVD